MTRFRTRYETAFALTAGLLALCALFAFSRLGPRTQRRDAAPVRRASADVASDTQRGEQALVGGRAIAATERDYNRFAAEDAAWRRRHGQLPDLFLMKRRAMEERVYTLNTSGRRAAAIGELEQWTAQHPRDREAMLWLARLLRAAGRTNESLAKYRQVLSLGEGAP